jgi:phosphoribosylaminoimidazolecarboxamide formyltransferase / IMP cyclohydrolase
MEIKGLRKISTALVSLYNKEPARELIACLHKYGVEIYSTGGTFDYIQSLDIPVKTVESLTGYPSILGGRVKTLHPMVFGGILARRNSDADKKDIGLYDIPLFDMVIVDLYPFEQALAEGAGHDALIEKIDIGGISLIRAAAKNHSEVVVVPADRYFAGVVDLLEQGSGSIELAARKQLAAAAFDVSSHYDSAIYTYLAGDDASAFKQSIQNSFPLRYGENPHQHAAYFGRLESHFDQLNGKALSYNNLLDIDAAFGLISEFDDPCFAIIKHTNVCGMAVRENMLDAWEAALAGDPISAFGGILITNQVVSEDVAKAIDTLFFEVLIAPGFDESSLTILCGKKNRIILKSAPGNISGPRFRTVLNGVLWQTADQGTTAVQDWTFATDKHPDSAETEDLVFANIIVKHLKSNAIALVRNKQLLGIGTGQTSRVDALNQAITKAGAFKHELEGATMASDAFFPFPDCVEIANAAGIRAVIQPGGSVKDQASIDFCNAAGMAMVFTGRRHFRH